MLSVSLSNIDGFGTIGGYEAYSPEYVEEEFCELRLEGILGSRG